MGSTNFVDQQNIYHHLQIFVDRQVKGDQLYSRSQWPFQEPKKNGGTCHIEGLFFRPM